MMRLVLMVQFLFLIACAPLHEAPSTQPEAAENKDVQKLLESPDTIVYDDVAELVLKKRCTECHSEKGKNIAGVNVESFEALLGQRSKATVVPFDTNRSSLFATLLIPRTQTRHMPPINKPQLSEDEINLVYQWILNGAKREVAEKVERPKTLAETLKPFFDEPQIIDYPLVKKYVFDTSCTECHSEKGSKANIDGAIENNQNMTTYDDYFMNRGIIPGRLIDTIFVDDEGEKKRRRGSRIFKAAALNQSMPPVKEGYHPLDAQRVKLLRLWILNCAIEDFSAITDDDLVEEIKIPGKIRNCSDAQ